MIHAKIFCKLCLHVLFHYSLDLLGLHLKFLKICLFLVVQLYVGMFELVNRFEVLLVLI